MNDGARFAFLRHHVDVLAREHLGGEIAQPLPFGKAGFLQRLGVVRQIAIDLVKRENTVDVATRKRGPQRVRMY